MINKAKLNNLLSLGRLSNTQYSSANCQDWNTFYLIMKNFKGCSFSINTFLNSKYWKCKIGLCIRDHLDWLTEVPLLEILWSALKIPGPNPEGDPKSWLHFNKSSVICISRVSLNSWSPWYLSQCNIVYRLSSHRFKCPTWMTQLYHVITARRSCVYFVETLSPL